MKSIITILTILSLLIVVHSLNFKPLLPGLEVVQVPLIGGFVGLLRAVDVPIANGTANIFVGIGNKNLSPYDSQVHHIYMVLEIDGDLFFEVLRFPGFILADLDVIDADFLVNLGIDYDFFSEGHYTFREEQDFFPIKYSFNLGNLLSYRYDATEEEHIFEWTGQHISLEYYGLNANYSFVTRISDDISEGIHIKHDANFWNLDNSASEGMQSERLSFILPMNFFYASITRLENGSNNDQFKVLVEGNTLFLKWDTNFVHQQKDGPTTNTSFNVVSDITKSSVPSVVIEALNDFLNGTGLRGVEDVEVSYGTLYFISNKTNADEIHWDPSMGMLFGVDENVENTDENTDDISTMSIVAVVVIIVFVVVVLLAVFFVGVINRNVLPNRIAARKHNANI